MIREHFFQNLYCISGSVGCCSILLKPKLVSIFTLVQSWFQKFSSILQYRSEFTVATTFSSSKKYGPHMPSLAIAHHTVTLGQCNGRSCSERGLDSAQYRKFCLLTVPHKWKWASSLYSTKASIWTFCWISKHKTLRVYITPEMINRVIDNFHKRVNLCVDNHDKHLTDLIFKNLIKCIFVILLLYVFIWKCCSVWFFSVILVFVLH